MKITEFSVAGPLLIEPKIHGDSRGFFTERYRKDLFDELQIPHFFQDNHSRSSFGVLRGLHYQYDKPQGKLVTALSGAIFDVAVDIRASSPTFGKSIYVELHGDKPAWLWVPAGFAHGFTVISREGADVLYKVDVPYNASGEGGLSWNCKEFEIPWPLKEPLLSEKDKAQKSWAAYIKDPNF